MKPRMGRFLMAAALVLSAGMASAAKHPAVKPANDAALANSVRHEIVMYPHYSMFDDVYMNVSNGAVRLTGYVSQPYKKEDIGRIAKSAGAERVENDIQVLPTSFQDDRLRAQLARAIYGDPTMLKYAMEPVKPIHIIVNHGHVMLTGVVDSQFDKQIAGTRAASAGLSFGKVVNNLQVAGPRT